jgi:trimethylamine--corrinoid protein Co-methyltransferase
MHYSIMNQDNIEQIHKTSVQILTETGIVLGHQEAKTLLLDYNARLENGRVLFPEAIIEESLSHIPENVILTGRDPQQSIELSGSQCFPHNVGGVPNLYDPSTGTRKPAVRSDNIQATRLLDALPNIASITPLFTPQDVPGPEMTLWMAYDTLLNTTKPFRSPGVQTREEVRSIVEMFRIVVPQGRFTIGVSPVSPLTFPKGIVDALFEVARQDQILGPLPCPILGATAPMSIAGGLALQNAEVLAAIVLAYLINPGLPIIYKGRLSIMDPFTGLSVWGNPEIGLISSATVQLAHYYGIPVDVYGLSTNAHTLDIQNGYERSLNALLPAVAGADEISGCGEMEAGLSSSLAQIVIDDEILASIVRVCSGFEVNPDSLGAKVITNAMNGSRNFLAERHTLNYLRSGEVLQTSLVTRESWSQWDGDGRQSIIERSERKAHQLLSSNEISALEDHQISEMNKVIQSFQPTNL